MIGWDDWLKSLSADIMWSGYSGPRQQRAVLSPFQEQVLWEEILRQASDAPLADLGGAARSARQAWGLVQAWRLPDPGSAPFADADATAFSGWMRRYYSRCNELALIDHARLADSVAPALRAGAIEIPAAMLLVGFDELTPQQREELVFYFTVGSTNMDYRSMVVDAEVMVVLGGWQSVFGYLDFLLLPGMCEWLETTDELDALLTPPGGFTRSMAGLMKLSL